MSTIKIQGTELTYNPADVITFDEGLIGLPNLRRMVLVGQSDISPFLWLASLDDETAFLVLEPTSVFPEYHPVISDDAKTCINLGDDAAATLLTIVSLSPDWKKSTVNLRAPLFINASEMRGAQAVLMTSDYKLSEPLPHGWDSPDAVDSNLTEQQVMPKLSAR